MLPDGCWPAAEEFCYTGRIGLLAPAATHVLRLCPRLRRIWFECGDASAAAWGAPAFEGLAAVAGTLESLEFESSMQNASCASSGGQRMAEVLSCLSRLQQLRFGWEHETTPSAAAEVLAQALPSLKALTSLELSGDTASMTTPQQLASWPRGLRELAICCDDSWATNVLAAAPDLGELTKLALTE